MPTHQVLGSEVDMSQCPLLESTQSDGQGN
jgi:hypothetical protein